MGSPFSRLGILIYAIIVATAAAAAGLYIGRQEVAGFENSVSQYSREIEAKLRAATQLNESLQKQLIASKAAQEELTRKLATAEEELRKARQPKPDTSGTADRQKPPRRTNNAASTP